MTAKIQDQGQVNAKDEYTPRQRRIIDARLVEADEDIKAGRLSRSFSTHREFIAHLHKAAKKPGSQ